MSQLKRSIVQALESNSLSSIASQAKEDRKVLSQLIRIAYDKETLIGWRAIKAIGLAARELIKTDPEFLRETIRKLLWSLSDESGGIGWSAPEILGEIVSAHPRRFHDIIPLIAEVYTIEEKVFRPGVVYALARIAEAGPELILSHKDLVIQALSDENPLVRVYAIEVIGLIRDRLSAEEANVIAALTEKLSSDSAEVWVYRNENFLNIQVKSAVKSIRWEKDSENMV